MKNLILPLFILIIVTLGCANTDSTSSPSNTSAKIKSAPETAKSTPVAISPITWGEYDNIYNTKSNSTDMQKDAQWSKFEGKTVAWQGKVEDVSKGTLGGLTLNIKMNPDTLTYDISLSLKSDQESEAMTLKKGEKVSFTGKLKSYGGAILPLTMDEGEIK